jgi:hypothetical protein
MPTSGVVSFMPLPAARESWAITSHTRSRPIVRALPTAGASGRGNCPAGATHVQAWRPRIILPKAVACVSPQASQGSRRLAGRDVGTTAARGLNDGVAFAG